VPPSERKKGEKRGDKRKVLMAVPRFVYLPGRKEEKRGASVIPREGGVRKRKRSDTSMNPTPSFTSLLSV